MKTLTKFFLGLSALALPLLATAGVNPTTAWFNNATFESDTINALAPAWDFVAGNGSTAASMSYTYKTVGVNLGNASGKVLSIANPSSTAETFAEPNANRQIEVKKTFPQKLTGIVYATFSGYTCTRGTAYTFLNSDGNGVFGVSGQNASNTLRYQLAKPTSDGTYLSGSYTAFSPSTGSLRGNWFQVEMVLNVSAATKELVKIKTTVGTTVNTYGPITLTNGTDISTFHIITGKYNAAGLDNVTIGQLDGNKLKNLKGESVVQTISGSAVSNTYSVDMYGTALDSTYILPNTNSNINWTITNWGTLSDADKALVTLTKDTTDSKKAILSVGSITADGTITIQSALGDSIVTKSVLLKTLSIEGLKSSLTDKANVGKALVSGVTDVNPYITSEKGKLNTVISNSEYLVLSVSSTISDLTLGLSNQETANTAFNTAIATYNNFVSTIATVQTTHDAEVRSAAFFTSIKASLQSAIDVAKAAKATVATAEDISAAQKAVMTAEAQFKSDVPAYAAMETQIASTNTRLAVVTPRVGDYFLNYDATAATSLTNAKTTADGLLGVQQLLPN